MCALSQFEGMCEKISSGNITVMELELIKSKFTQMKRLCEAATAETNTSESFLVLQRNLEMRLQEFDQFSSYRDKLNHFMTQMNTICIEGK